MNAYAYMQQQEMTNEQRMRVMANQETPPGAVPYMLARPMPIETAPENLTRILGLVKVDGKSASIWAECRRRAKREHGWYVPNVWSTQPTHWLPLPPAPEDA